MARARLVNTGPSRKRAQPTCSKCGKAIEPGTKRFTWSFRYGGTYNRHQECGAPRPSELTQGRVGELYAAQEAIEDALENQPEEIGDFEGWASDVAAAVDAAVEVAEELGSEYRETADTYFSGGGPNAELADGCESWSSELQDASSTISGIEVNEPDEEDYSDENWTVTSEDDQTGEEALADAREQALSDAIDEVRSAADDASNALEL